MIEAFAQWQMERFGRPRQAAAQNLQGIMGIRCYRHGPLITMYH
jgi:hypothetical protein